MENGPAYLHDLVVRAEEFATKAHEGVLRRNRPIPYIKHPARIAVRVANHAIASPVTIAVAWLHDVIEDTPTRPEDLVEEFGEEVARGCIALTNPSQGSDAPRKERKTKDRRHVALLSNEWKIVKLFDRIDNLTDLWIDRDSEKPKFIKLYAGESRQLLDEAFEGVDPELEAELKELIEKLESL